ncbi:hypothetical protein AB0C04_31685 [Micromonospora sp. NPDC048909]|uniref:hypothetical protein n=1 Tax=Micromonospora sp. NPDC048909 TaxID=3155643 RepID=UPI00340BA79A
MANRTRTTNFTAGGIDRRPEKIGDSMAVPLLPSSTCTSARPMGIRATSPTRSTMSMSRSIRTSTSPQRRCARTGSRSGRPAGGWCGTALIDASATVGLALLATDWAEEDIPLIQTIGLLSDRFGPLAAEALRRRRGGEEALLWLAQRTPPHRRWASDCS